MLPGLLLEERVRLRIPLERIDGSRAVVTWHAEGERVAMPFAAEALARTAEERPAQRVTDWFGRDPARLFLHVPQVATYQPRVAVGPEDVERPV